MEKPSDWHEALIAMGRKQGIHDCIRAMCPHCRVMLEMDKDASPLEAQNKTRGNWAHTVGARHDNLSAGYVCPCPASPLWDILKELDAD